MVAGWVRMAGAMAGLLVLAGISAMKYSFSNVKYYMMIICDISGRENLSYNLH